MLTDVIEVDLDAAVRDDGTEMVVGGVSYFVIGGVGICMISVLIIAIALLARRGRSEQQMKKTLDEYDSQSLGDAGWLGRDLPHQEHYITANGTVGTRGHAKWKTNHVDPENNEEITLDWEDVDFEMSTTGSRLCSNNDDEGDVSVMYSTSGDLDNDDEAYSYVGGGNDDDDDNDGNNDKFETALSNARSSHSHIRLTRFDIDNADEAYLRGIPSPDGYAEGHLLSRQVNHNDDTYMAVNTKEARRRKGISAPAHTGDMPNFSGISNLIRIQSSSIGDDLDESYLNREDVEQFRRESRALSLPEDPADLVDSMDKFGDSDDVIRAMASVGLEPREGEDASRGSNVSSKYSGLRTNHSDLVSNADSSAEWLHLANLISDVDISAGWLPLPKLEKTTKRPSSKKTARRTIRISKKPSVRSEPDVSHQLGSTLSPVAPMDWDQAMAESMHDFSSVCGSDKAPTSNPLFAEEFDGTVGLTSAFGKSSHARANPLYHGDINEGDETGAAAK